MGRIQKNSLKHGVSPHTRLGAEQLIVVIKHKRYSGTFWENEVFSYQELQLNLISL